MFPTGIRSGIECVRDRHFLKMLHLVAHFSWIKQTVVLLLFRSFRLSLMQCNDGPIEPFRGTDRDVVDAVVET
jgi:hypothetical protein